MADAPASFSAERLRLDFPALAPRGDGTRLIYLDSAATTQKPECVIDAVASYYRQGVGNVQRGAHALGARATAAHEAARVAVQRLLGAAHVDEVVLTSGCTAAINLVAYAYGDTNVGPGDEVLVSMLEHHSNLLPWQQLCERRGARLRLWPLNTAGELELGTLEQHLSERTRLVAVAHVSNTIGAESPLGGVVAQAARVGARVLVDGAQAAGRRPVDVQALGCDFYAVSGHKLYGPSGIGALYGRRELLAKMAPPFSGGGMVDEVGLERSSFAEVPRRFEAGTPAVEGAVGLSRAIEYLESLGMERVMQHDLELTGYARRALARVPGLVLLGAPSRPLGVVSFVFGDMHPHDVSTIVDQAGIAVRAGHHCASLVHAHFGVAASVRASFGLYSTRDDVDALVGALGRAREVLGR
jgi:cysteine desulfurase / selenocysteine lyase